MKNIQIIDGAVNCVYDVFAATDEEFALIFAPGTDIAFNDELWEGKDEAAVGRAFRELWKRPVRKMDIQGIHGTIFYGLGEKKVYYPTRTDAGAVNPDGGALRGWKP